MEKDCVDYINIFGSLAVSITTLIFAIIIYRRISFKKATLDKQFETITELIHDLQNTSIDIIIKINEPDYSLAHSHTFFSLIGAKKKFKKTDGLNIYFTSNFISNLPFTKFARHPFIPIEIANIIDKFLIYFSKKIDKKNLKSFVSIDFSHNSIEPVPTNNIELFSCNDSEIGIDFNSFFEICVKLDFEIKHWLKEYGVKSLNLR